MLLARICAVVGLDLTMKTYPGGEPIRDGADLHLLRDFRRLLHESIDWAAEVPLFGSGDQRAWDGFLRGPGGPLARRPKRHPTMARRPSGDSQ